MTTPPLSNDRQNSRNIVSSPRNSDDVEDKFWAALNFAIDDTLPCKVFDPKAARNRLARRSSPSPYRSDLEGWYLPLSPKLQHKSSQRHMKQASSTQTIAKKNFNSLRVRVPPVQSHIKAVRATPTTALPILSPSASKARWNLATPCAVQPETPVLNTLVSNFLDSLVRESQSRSATPLTAVAFESDRDSMIVGSEVVIQVVEDMDQSAPESPVEEDALTRFSRSFERSEDDGFRALQIPPSPISIPAKGGFDMPSAFVANGPASCAQELDALWRMRFDRMFAREMYY